MRYDAVMQLRTYTSAERGRIAQLARAINVHPVLVSQWASGRRGVPIEHCALIEKATAGAVRRQDLRPSDWQQIWPELAGGEVKLPDPGKEAAHAG